MARKWQKQHAEFRLNTSKADNKLSDSDDDVTCRNFQSGKAILSLFLRDSKESDFSVFFAEQDSLMNHQPYCIFTFFS